MFFYCGLILSIFLLYNSTGFVVPDVNVRNIPCAVYMNQELPPTLWSSLSSTFKQTARNWFIQRAEKKTFNGTKSQINTKQKKTKNYYWNYMKFWKINKSNTPVIIHYRSTDTILGI